MASATWPMPPPAPSSSVPTPRNQPPETTGDNHLCSSPCCSTATTPGQSHPPFQLPNNQHRQTNQANLLLWPPLQLQACPTQGYEAITAAATEPPPQTLEHRRDAPGADWLHVPAFSYQRALCNNGTPASADHSDLGLTSHKCMQCLHHKTAASSHPTGRQSLPQCHAGNC